MDLSEFMNIILGGGLVGTVATIGSLRATVRKAKAEAMKAEAGAEAMRIDNAEHATRILMENIGWYGGDHWLLAGYCEKSESGSDEGRGRRRGYAHR